MKLLAKAYALLTGGRAVALQDFEKKIRYSVAYVDPFGVRYARVYPIMRVGHCILSNDGTVSDASQSSYMEYWRYV